MGGQNWLTTVRRKAEGWGSPMSSGCGEWRNNRCKADGGRVVLTGGKDAMPGKLRQSVNRKGGVPLALCIGWSSVPRPLQTA